MPAIDAEALADTAVLLGLISREELRGARDEADDGSGEALARALLRKGLLTSWQVDRLNKGEHSGFFYGGCKILFHIAEGTFARVYRGRKQPGNQSVAVKVLRRRFTTDPAAVIRFNQEAEAGLKLVRWPCAAATLDDSLRRVASPKSTSLAIPREPIRMLVPLISRWVTPLLIEYARPAERPIISGKASSEPSLVRNLRKSRRFEPSTYSIII